MHDNLALNSSSLILSINEITSYFVSVAIVVWSLFAIRLIRTSSRMSSIQLTTIIMLDFSSFCVATQRRACHRLIHDMRLTLFYCHFCNPNRMNFFIDTPLSRDAQTHTQTIDRVGFLFCCSYTARCSTTTPTIRTTSRSLCMVYF